eukprot:TRINITY_DN2700_c0_g2_i1.p1 TRINITY_DN2700_c0_g2~~TRINITY_DN2700_c0_g2_i1.p1  ORF type:complete len:302 (+),score=45.25 TRINITY_DN2700_c0_g2_i1:37-942(+)
MDSEASFPSLGLNFVISRPEWSSAVTSFITEQEVPYHAIFVEDGAPVGLDSSNVPVYLQSLNGFEEWKEKERCNVVFLLKLRGGNQVFGLEGSFSKDLSQIAQRLKDMEEKENQSPGSRVKFVFYNSTTDKEYRFSGTESDIFCQTEKAGPGYSPDHFEFIYVTPKRIKNKTVIKYLDDDRCLVHFIEQDITPKTELRSYRRGSSRFWKLGGRCQLTVVGEANVNLILQQYFTSTFMICGNPRRYRLSAWVPPTNPLLRFVLWVTYKLCYLALLPLRFFLSIFGCGCETDQSGCSGYSRLD